MSRRISYLTLATGLLLLLTRAAVPAAAQDKEKEKEKETGDPKEASLRAIKKAEEAYRRSYEAPDTVVGFWAKIHYEIDVGKYDVAALHLKGLLEKQPPEETDKELVKIEEAEGYSKFLVLQGIRTWSENPQFQEEAEKNVKQLFQRVT